ncbi:MAG: GNAT family N-acetyltransferase [Rhodoferax sp.]|nr:GNAT family N-acetyltransferase [Rhodoferax sp.]
MQIELLKASDAPQYRIMMLEAYTLAADAYTSTAEERAAEPESFWVNRIAGARGLSAAFGAIVGQDLVGTVALEFATKPKTRHKGAVIGMYVRPHARGAGTGKLLLAAAVAHARAMPGLHLLNLTVTEGNEPALKLYRSFGFEVFGTEPMAIRTSSGYKAKIHMWLPLTSAQPQ